MKTIGLIGGMSWESTVTYYQIINEKIKENLGGFHSAKILLYSVDFSELEANMSTGNWEANTQILTNAAMSLEKGGADFILICTNTMHKLVPQIQPKINLPIIHIAQATADKLKENNIKKVGLLGTKFTMTEDFYSKVLNENGIDVIIPNDEDVEKVNNIIFKELCLGEVKESSKKEYLRIIDDLEKQGAQGVILGCTEIGILINQNDTACPVFDTTIIHSEKAAQLAIN